MSKPKPKQGVIIKEVSDGLLYIWFTTPDEAEFIATHAPTFGNYYPPSITQQGQLFVHPSYDVKEVIAFLQQA